MITPTRCLIFAVLSSLAAAGGAAEPLTQTTVSAYANGKAVAGLIFPIGARPELSAIAHHVDTSADQIRYQGNVHGRLIAPSGQQIIVFGDEIVMRTETITAERAQAVRDIEAMAGPDQLFRGKPDNSPVTAEEMQQQSAIDVINMKRLAAIIDTYGWPGLRFAGAASQTAFLVLQHADNASQRKYLPLLRAAVARGDALGGQLAMLEDRVRIADGKAQLYGTQLGGAPLRFDPIEDAAHVDERRRSVGLEPMADYAKHFGLTYP